MTSNNWFKQGRNFTLQPSIKIDKRYEFDFEENFMLFQRLS